MSSSEKVRELLDKIREQQRLLGASSTEVKHREEILRIVTSQEDLLSRAVKFIEYLVSFTDPDDRNIYYDAKDWLADFDKLGGGDTNE